jgi:hypothetical protein
MMNVSLRTTGRLAALAIGVALALPAQAQTPAAPTSAGPGRIICKAASSCVLGIGTPAKLRYQINATALPAADQQRLSKQCTAKATPCIVTIEGTEMGDALKVKAGKITWYN